MTNESLAAPNAITKVRSLKYDNVKALLIFLVVWGHMLLATPTAEPGAFFIYILIYTFHMPAFVYVLGMFAKPRVSKMLKFAGLYVVLQVIYTLFFKYVLRDPDAIFTLVEPQWSLWYLMAAVVYLALCWIVPKDLPRKTQFLLVAAACVLAVGAGFVPFIGKPFTLSRIVCFLPFFLAGRFRLFSVINKWWGTLLAFVAAVLLTLIYIVAEDGNFTALYMYSGYADTGTSWWSRPLVMVIAFLMIGVLVSRIPDKRIPVLTDVGKQTLFVYLGHGIPVKLLCYYYVPEQPILFTFFVSLIILFGLYGLSRLSNKVCSALGR